MTALEKLEKVASDRSGVVLDIWKASPTVMAVTLHHSHRDFVDGFEVATGKGETLEEAVVDLLAKMGVL